MERAIKALIDFLEENQESLAAFLRNKKIGGNKRAAELIDAVKRVFGWFDNMKHF